MTRGSTPRTLKNLTLVLLGAAGGAAASYYLDPDRGRRRRRRASDQVGAAVRRGLTEAEKRLEYEAGRVKGEVATTAQRVHPEQTPDHKTLKHKVETEVLGQSDIHKSDVVVHAHGDIVELRGQVHSRQEMDRIVDRTRRVEGVGEVKNLLHLPGQPEPATRPAREATRFLTGADQERINRGR